MHENESNNNKSGDANDLNSGQISLKTVDTKCLDAISISKSWVLLRSINLLLALTDPTCISLIGWAAKTITSLVAKKNHKRPNRNDWIGAVIRCSQFL